MYAMNNRNYYKCSLNLTDLNGKNGFTISSPYPESWLGYSINFVKDINGDKINDLIIGAPNFSQSGFEAGQSYIILGKNQNFTSNVSVANLNGTNGFAINGISPDDNSGWSVSSAGDINDDGITDILVGAPNAVFGFGPGNVYVIFGRDASFLGVFNLSSINGTNGFVISGVEESDNLGFSISPAGDVNDDGIDDVVIGNPLEQNSQGQAYIIYGSTSGFNKEFFVTNLNAKNGFTLSGDASHNVMQAGWSVAGLGDVNGDKIADIIIGAPEDSSAYILFGNEGGFPAVINLYTLNGNNGFGFKANDYNQVGSAVSKLGDINGDGINDIAISSNSSENFFIFGSKISFSSILTPSSLNGNNGFIVKSSAATFSYWTVSGGGDVNADGINDIVLANPGLKNQTGVSYVIYGNSTFNKIITLEDLNSITGYQINGINAGDKSGTSVSGMGDINNDGISDILIGAPGGNNGYVIFGSQNSKNIPCCPIPNPSATPSATNSITPSSTSSPSFGASVSPTATLTKHSGHSSGAEIIGEIVGGMLGGLALIAGAAVIYYKCFHHSNTQHDELLLGGTHHDSE